MPGAHQIKVKGRSKPVAIYHLSVKTGSRGGGQSAKAKNEYIEREGKYAGLNGQKKSDVLNIASGNMPEWARQNHHEYWKAADQFERANGRLYKEVEFALPKELTAGEMEKAARDFAERLTGKERLPYTLAIHIGDPENPHCHLMISERANDGIPRQPGAWFSRANTSNPALGGAKKSTSLMPKEWLIDTRAAWEEAANGALKQAGQSERVDCRTLAAQGIEREPSAHRGVHREARERHQEMRRLEREISEAWGELEAADRREGEVRKAAAEGRASVRASYEAWKKAKGEKLERERMAQEEQRRADLEREAKRRASERGRGFSR